MQGRERLVPSSCLTAFACLLVCICACGSPHPGSLPLPPKKMHTHTHTHTHTTTTTATRGSPRGRVVGTSPGDGCRGACHAWRRNGRAPPPSPPSSFSGLSLSSSLCPAVNCSTAEECCKQCAQPTVLGSGGGDDADWGEGKRTGERKQA